MRRSRGQGQGGEAGRASGELNSRFEKAESVNTDENVSVSVDLEQVSVERVEPQPSEATRTTSCVRPALLAVDTVRYTVPDGKRGVVLEVADGFRVANSNQLLHDQVEAQAFVLG